MDRGVADGDAPAPGVARNAYAWGTGGMHLYMYNHHPLGHGFQGGDVKNVSYNFVGTPHRGKIL